MAAFSDYTDILPDPNNKVADTGAADSSGSAGPGFRGLNLKSSQQIGTNRTRSGRGIHTSDSSHYWTFSVTYNELTKDSFDVVDSFLLRRNGRQYPFFVILPDRAAPKDSAFNTFCQSNTISLVGAHSAGSSTILVDAAISMSGEPSPGDIINISDSSNVSHLNAYKVVGVETNANYKTANGQPTTLQRRLQIYPPLQRAAANNSEIVFINPKFRVYQPSNIQSVDIDENGLYNFSFNVEEIQP